LLQWEQTVADTRVHGTTRRQVGKHFTDVELPALEPLRTDPFPLFHEARRKVSRDGHIEVERAFYAVRPEYLGRRVWARWDGRLVRIYNERMEQIVVYAKQEPGRFRSRPEFIASEKISAIELGAARLLSRVRSRIGPRSGSWAAAMIEARGVEGTRVLLGLLNLANRHSVADVERACEVAAGYGAYRLRTIRALIQRQAPKQELMEFLSDHEMIRPMSEYGRLVHDAVQFRNARP
jgi:hypothetical protein